MDSLEHHRQRSEFIRKLVQRSLTRQIHTGGPSQVMPKTIVQYWHNLRELPQDVEECMASWRNWRLRGFDYLLFDEHSAKAFIHQSLGRRYSRAFEHCYHPAMQSDYFRLCFVFAEGGGYFDADDICVGTSIDWLFADGRLKLQPLCYDKASGAMVRPSEFLQEDAFKPDWIFYFNNNPLIATRGHSLVEHALMESTSLLEIAVDGELPEIQATTGPGNLSKSIFQILSFSEVLERELLVLRDWELVARSRWPLSYRGDARNWRLSNKQRFCAGKE